MDYDYRWARDLADKARDALAKGKPFRHEGVAIKKRRTPGAPTYEVERGDEYLGLIRPLGSAVDEFVYQVRISLGLVEDK